MVAVTVALAAAFALAACWTAAAGSQVVLDHSIHKRFGVVPAVGARGAAHLAGAPFQGGTCNADGNDCTPLSYNGGPVQHGENDYLFFWAPSGHSVPNEYVSGLQTWLGAVAANDYSPSNPFAIDQQYYDMSGLGGSKSFVPYAVTDAGTILDTDSYPASGCTDTANGESFPVCLTSEQIVSELSSYIAAHNLPTGIDVQYYVLTPQGVASCFDSSSAECAYSSYCGYHSYAGSGQSQIVYADMPWLYQVPGCDTNEAFGSGYPNPSDIDAVVSVFSHELSETMTDPNLDAWIQNGGTDNGYEIGDKCAYIYGSGGYGSLSGLSNNGNGFWNVGLEGSDYLMQLEFDNRSENCALEDRDTQPSVSVSVDPSSPVRESPATFTAEVTDPAGVSSIEWHFGDGVSASGSSVVQHTYATLGSKTLTVLVIDEHGNEKQLTEKLNVTDTPPTASFTVSSGSPTAGQPLSFDGSTSSDPEGTISGYSWSWGDGTAPGSGATPTHTYAAPGTYTVTLTVTDQTGASAQLSREVTIAPAPAGGGEGAKNGSEGGSGSGNSLATPSTTSASSTNGSGGPAGKGSAAKAATKSCNKVTKRVHGHRRKVKVCRASKPKPKKPHGKHG